jgi:predicted GNAT family N-acyltransferase
VARKEPGWVIEPLGKRHDRAPFKCGVAALDRYLREQARQDAARHVAVPFVLVREGDNVVKGYYTLSSSGVDLGNLPAEVARRLPSYPVVPVTLLGRLAVDRTCRGQGHGERLLVDALRRSLLAADQVGSTAVVVDAKDTDAQAFYQHFDFLVFPGHSKRLFLPMATIAKLFEG